VERVSAATGKLVVNGVIILRCCDGRVVGGTGSEPCSIFHFKCQRDVIC
jgi:hypothetical protein